MMTTFVHCSTSHFFYGQVAREPTQGIIPMICEPIAGYLRKKSEKTRLSSEADKTDALIAARAVALTLGALMPAIQESIFLVHF